MRIIADVFDLLDAAAADQIAADELNRGLEAIAQRFQDMRPAILAMRGLTQAVDWHMSYLAGRAHPTTR